MYVGCRICLDYSMNECEDGKDVVWVGGNGYKGEEPRKLLTKKAIVL